jgi:3-oxoacyl-[acyl-carrier-protein] synthase II
MMNRGYLIPTLNLDGIDPACGKIRHVRGVEPSQPETVVKNNFALGGVNSSIVLRRYEND